jgi:hypothetical protein
MPHVTEADYQRAQLEGGMNMMLQLVEQGSQLLQGKSNLANDPDVEKAIETIDKAWTQFKTDLLRYRDVR